MTSQYETNLRAHGRCSVANPSILIWKIGHVHHRMNIAWIIEWILFESSNEYCLNCFINVGENRMHIKANLSNFATSLSNVLNKIKYIWILLSICGNYQTHIRDIEYWHISATIVHDSDKRNIETKTASKDCCKCVQWCITSSQVSVFFKKNNEHANAISTCRQQKSQLRWKG